MHQGHLICRIALMLLEMLEILVSGISVPCVTCPTGKREAAVQVQNSSIVPGSVRAVLLLLPPPVVAIR